MRLIDADAFEVVFFENKSEEFVDGATYVLEMIDNAPTVEARPVVHGEWIPVEKELPKYNDEYNVTVGVASEFGYFEKVTTLRYRIVKGEEAKWILPTHDVYTVIAWQPLPQTYREKVE